MDNQQILEHLDDIWTFGHEPTDEEREAARDAIDAVQKQILKKPILDTIYQQQYYCPNCEGFLTRKNEDKPHHCKCGQAIDWDD